MNPVILKNILHDFFSVWVTSSLRFLKNGIHQFMLQFRFPWNSVFLLKVTTLFQSTRVEKPIICNCTHLVLMSDLSLNVPNLSWQQFANPSFFPYPHCLVWTGLPVAQIMTITTLLWPSDFMVFASSTLKTVFGQLYFFILAK